jgi:EmrB/QacA subfamily drug resistance transporter
VSSATRIEAREPAQPAQVQSHFQVSGSYRWLAAVVVSLGSITSILSATVANVALPALQHVFAASLTEIQWILTGYMLGLAGVIPISGYMSDRFGSKRVYMATLTGFVVASLLCGMAWNTSALIGFRVIQGAAGGMIMPVGMTMLVSMSAPGERGRMMGILGVPMWLAPSLGPTVGGWLLQVADWRWIFWMNVPVGVLAIILGLRFLRPSPRREAQRLDLVGLLLATPGVAAVIYGLTQASSHGWISPSALGPIALGLLLVAAFAAWELRQATPLLDLRIFRDPGFTAASGTSVIVAGALFGAVFLVPLYIQQVQGRDTLHAGLLIAAQGITAAVMLPLSGWLTDRYGARPVVLTGLTVMASATLLMSRLSPSTTDATWVLLLGLRGLGMGCATMPAFSSAYSALAVAAIARATAVFNTLQRVASAFGIAIVATVAEARIADHVYALGSSGPGTGAIPRLLTAPVQAAMTMGFSDAFLLSGSLALFGLPLAMLLRRPAPAGRAEPLAPRIKSTAWALAGLAGVVLLLAIDVAFGFV